MSDEMAIDYKASHVARTWKHAAPMLGCRFDPTGRFVFAASMDQKVYRWDLQTDKQLPLEGHESWLRGIGFSPDGKQVYTGGYDGKLCFWQNDPEAGEASLKPTCEIEAHPGLDSLAGRASRWKNGRHCGKRLGGEALVDGNRRTVGFIHRA